jgi:hypothetical protein
MLTGPVSLPCVVSAIDASAVSLSVMFAVADAPVIVTPPLLGLLIVACRVRVPSSRASFRTTTPNVPVDAPLATVTWAPPAIAVMSVPSIAVPPERAMSKVMGEPGCSRRPRRRST